MNTPHVILLATHPEEADRGRACLLSLGGEALVQRLLRQCNEVGFYSIQVLYPAFADSIAAKVASCLPSAKCIPLPTLQDAGEETLCCHEKHTGKKENTLWQDSGGKQRGVLFMDAGSAVSEQFFLRLREHTTGSSFQVMCLPDSGDHPAAGSATDIHTVGTSQHALCALYLSPEDIPANMPSLCTFAASVFSLAALLQHYGIIVPSKKMAHLASEGLSCHSADGYRAAQTLLESQEVCAGDTILLVDVSGLKQTEEHDPVRVDWLMNKILEEQVWTQPLCVALAQGFVMDGHHRFAVAKKMGLSKVPAILFSYRDVAVWSLRPAMVPLTKKCFLASIAAGKVYPYKTVKHHFPKAIPSIAIPLSLLR